jgi:hypothetical protein
MCWCGADLALTKHKSCWPRRSIYRAQSPTLCPALPHLHQQLSARHAVADEGWSRCWCQRRRHIGGLVGAQHKVRPRPAAAVRSPATRGGAVYACAYYAGAPLAGARERVPPRATLCNLWHTQT